METLTLKSTFTEKDGTVVPLTIHASQHGANATNVLIVLGEDNQRYNAHEATNKKTKQFFGGMSFCNPSDKPDMATGIKVACRHALEIGTHNNWYLDDVTERNRAIYRECRIAVRNCGIRTHIG